MIKTTPFEMVFIIRDIMRDIGCFRTEYGTADLVLNQIPYTKTAYIHLLEILQPEELIEECRQFCVACGAEQVFVTADAVPLKLPEYMQVLEMAHSREALADTDACLMPVTEEHLPEWLEVYHERMAGVDHAAHLSAREGKQLLTDGGGYFVHRKGEFLGIGKAKGDTIECIAAVKPGAGRDVVLALVHALACDQVRLEVASTNLRAIRLYEKLGFVNCGKKRSWYRVM